MRQASWITCMLALGACSTSTGSVRRAVVPIETATYMHRGFDVGPAVFTDASGHVIEERRFEPYGTSIDARLATGLAPGRPDLAARDLSPLGKRVDASTGWSDHGARWLAPEAGRWLTGDPLVEGPEITFMAAPWALHPYQYVDSNPVAYWDPDGREPVSKAAQVARALYEGAELATDVVAGDAKPLDTTVSLTLTVLTWDEGFMASNAYSYGALFAIKVGEAVHALQKQSECIEQMRIEQLDRHIGATLAAYAARTGALEISYTHAQVNRIQYLAAGLIDPRWPHTDVFFDKAGRLYRQPDGRAADDAARVGELDRALESGTVVDGVSGRTPSSVRISGFGSQVRLDFTSWAARHEGYIDEIYDGDRTGSSGSFQIDQPRTDRCDPE